MIKAIIFDCFGVLATDELLPFLAEHFGNKPAVLAEARTVCRRVSEGKETYETMISRLAEMADIPLEDARSRIENNVANEALFAYIGLALKPKYKIGFLSNAGRNWLAGMFEPEQIALLDTVVLSHEIGYVKPDAQAYEITADRLGVRLDECVMVDDREPYCEGARAVGMRAVQYRSVRQLKNDLAKEIESAA